MSKTLFPELETEHQSKLVWKGNSSSFTKAQINFNKALQKHKLAMAKLKETDYLLEIANQAYVTKIVPQLNLSKELEKKRLLSFVDLFLNAKVKLGKKQKEALRELILEACEEGMDEDRSFYLNILYKIETPEERNYRLKEKKKAEKYFKKKFGLDVDLDELNKTDFESREEREAHEEKYKEFFEKYAESQNDFEYTQQRQRAKTKSKSQLDKEKKLAETEKILGADINKLFKDLAKLIHPDREQDEELRAKKSVLMTALSNARDSMNIAEILEIKLKVDELIPDNESEINFNDSTLTRFVKVINEKIKELEQTAIQKCSNHPLLQHLNVNKLTPETLQNHVNEVLNATISENEELKDEIEHIEVNPKYIKVIIENYQEEMNDYYSDFNITEEELWHIFNRK